MNRTKFFILICLGMLTGINSYALPGECIALMQKVEKRLQGKGIQNYVLEWQDASTVTSMRVVGRCNKGDLKLVYSQKTVNKKNVEQETKTKLVDPINSEPKEEIKVAPSPLNLLSSQKIATSPPVKSNDVQTLIDSLYSNTGKFGDRIQEIIDRSDVTVPLIKAYYAATNDATFRFNVILLLNQKIKTNKIDNLELDAISQCLLDGLKDNSPLVRGEALWGLGQTRNKKWAPAVNALLNDPDAAVRSEAQMTANILR